MKKQNEPKPQFEFLSEHGILIDHVSSQSVSSPSSYILNLIAFLDEAERLKAKLLLVLAPAEVYHMDFKMHEWVSKYLIPQMSHLGILKIAFCAKSLPEEMNEHTATFGKNPEIGVFTSMPEAKAWIMGIIDKKFSLTFDLSDSGPVKNNLAS